ncbi:uncharacterized protein BO88DRAFT_489217 [Aspergillus vadensis CBS 113365]|uniref:Uncharacterized protein n=1 Tax=Aspergillus vadensis (strain CBS 113365 / IMI 142717 / IBT 24658) TaxID=1448311 RepID=A0A319B4D5_ASPVC|nr:hypothetical protein BO88DRAFT_489217 [Aspergillus vadensis CBS 113365]PYH67245.1 hypothetical protein BO88DRAFT_489217 [Aspergillus vadensis CBS 113365]
MAMRPSSVGNDLDANCLHVAALDDRPQGSHDRRTAVSGVSVPYWASGLPVKAPSTHGTIPFAPEQLALSLFACIVLLADIGSAWDQGEGGKCDRFYARFIHNLSTGEEVLSSSGQVHGSAVDPFQQLPAACYVTLTVKAHRRKH